VYGCQSISVIFSTFLCPPCMRWPWRH